MNVTPPAKDNDLPKMKHGVGNTDRYMPTLNCMLGKNHKTLYNCNCFNVVVNVFLKGSYLIVYDYIWACLLSFCVSKSWLYLFKGKIMF